RRAEAGGRPFFYSRSPYPLSMSFNKSFTAYGSTVTAVRGAGGPVEDATYFLHEFFHAYQDERFVQPTQRKYPVEDPADIALADVERRSLRSWLERGDADAMRDFAAARARRRRLFPASVAELGEERIEGTAFFVEMAAL